MMKGTILSIAVAGLLYAGCAGAATNVSCTDSVKSLNKTATTTFSVVCPVNCTTGSVWGSGLYTSDSAICVAAVHAGVIKEKGGMVKVTLKPGLPSYSGTFQNGVTTGSWGSYQQSFTVAP